MLAHQVLRWANLIRLPFFRTFTLGEDDTAAAGTGNHACANLAGGVEKSTAIPGQFFVHSGALLFRPRGASQASGRHREEGRARSMPSRSGDVPTMSQERRVGETYKTAVRT